MFALGKRRIFSGYVAVARRRDGNVCDGKCGAMVKFGTKVFRQTIGVFAALQLITFYSPSQ
jgi:hypothetical protein